jgi:2-polyprenyl-3-methyl-5-hydroxy-6-metoxy-1,4-benzoquinol methylase
MRLQYERTPAHRKYLETRLSRAAPDSLPVLEDLAKQIHALAGPRLPDICDNYDFICRIVRQEEIFFRRHGRYRLSSFADANRLVYADAEYMGKYMDGLLLTQIYWSNHSASYQFYKNVFLGKAPTGYDYLEIGPGHGLLLHQAISDVRSGSVTGWDLSQASIDRTREALKMLGARGKSPSLLLQDLYAADDQGARFDCVTFSEVLEHLEDPKGALVKLRSLLKPTGRLFVNVPINSPAPDHLYLLESPEEAVAAVEAAGFEIEHAEFYPMTNHTLEQARKHKLTISACIVGRRAA